MDSIFNAVCNPLLLLCVTVCGYMCVKLYTLYAEAFPYISPKEGLGASFSYQHLQKLIEFPERDANKSNPHIRVGQTSKGGMEDLNVLLKLK